MTDTLRNIWSTQIDELITSGKLLGCSWYVEKTFMGGCLVKSSTGYFINFYSQGRLCVSDYVSGSCIIGRLKAESFLDLLYYKLNKQQND